MYKRQAPYLDNLPTGPREKFAANIAAIQKLKEIEQRVANGGSPAFEDEQKILAQYTGCLLYTSQAELLKPPELPAQQ